MRLIDADLVKEFAKENANLEKRFFINWMLRCIPTVGEEPKIGKWINPKASNRFCGVSKEYQCSCCSEYSYKAKYCNCGAKMENYDEID